MEDIGWDSDRSTKPDPNVILTTPLDKKRIHIHEGLVKTERSLATQIRTEKIDQADCSFIDSKYLQSRGQLAQVDGTKSGKAFYHVLPASQQGLSALIFVYVPSEGGGFGIPLRRLYIR